MRHYTSTSVTNSVPRAEHRKRLPATPFGTEPGRGLYEFWRTANRIILPRERRRSAAESLSGAADLYWVEIPIPSACRRESYPRNERGETDNQNPGRKSRGPQPSVSPVRATVFSQGRKPLGTMRSDAESPSGAADRRPAFCRPLLPPHRSPLPAWVPHAFKRGGRTRTRMTFAFLLRPPPLRGRGTHAGPEQPGCHGCVSRAAPCPVSHTRRRHACPPAGPFSQTPVACPDANRSQAASCRFR